MKSNPLLALFVWILTLGVVPDVFSQDAQPREPRFEALNMTAVVSPTRTYSGLPVALTITIRNEGEEPVMIPSRFALWESNLRAIVVKAEEEEIPVTGSVMCGTGRKPPPLSELKPSESRRTKLWVRSCWVPVLEPGYYCIRSGFKVADGAWLDAPEIILEVSKPSKELEASAELYTPLRGFVESWPGQIGDHDDEGQQIEAAETLVRDYADTIYGKYAAYLLGRKHQRQGDKSMSRDERHKEPEHYGWAAKHLETLSAWGAPENIYLEVLLHLAYVYRRLESPLQLRETSRKLRSYDLPFPISEMCERLLWADVERK
ncbi:MAG: hypothetical protein O7H41_15830 [Planctomycetota bacterium]|nr:hypothetical protein [Planctomycetota bacterium]